MDIVILGAYKKEDVSMIEEIATANGLKVVWNYQQYNIEAGQGIKELVKYYNLYQTGVLVEYDFIDGNTFYSEPILNEVSDYYMATEWENKTLKLPRLFSFFNALDRSQLKKMIIAFADEWDASTTVRIEQVSYANINRRLNSVFVWCFGYRNLQTNSETRDTFHPLVLEVTKEK